MTHLTGKPDFRVAGERSSFLQEFGATVHTRRKEAAAAAAARYRSNRDDGSPYAMVLIGIGEVNFRVEASPPGFSGSRTSNDKAAFEAFSMAPDEAAGWEQALIAGEALLRLSGLYVGG